MLALGPLMTSLSGSIGAFSNAANSASNGNDLMGMLQGKKTTDAAHVKKPQSVYEILQAGQAGNQGAPADSSDDFWKAVGMNEVGNSNYKQMGSMAMQGMNNNSQAQQMQNPMAMMQQMAQAQKGGPDMEYIRAMQASNNPLLKMLGG